MRGKFVVHLRIADIGDPAEGERLIAPMRGVAPVIVDQVRVMPSTAVDSIHQDPVDPLPFYERCSLLRELTPEAIDALLELSRSLGMGGRDRRAGSVAEKARVNVTRALRTAITRIEEVAPDFGRHLDRAVHTGSYCSYDPVRDVLADDGPTIARTRR